MSAAAKFPFERRSCFRYDHEVEVTVEIDGDRIPATSSDLSTGGMRLQVARGVTAGDSLVLRFTLPALPDEIVAEAVVRWVDTYDARVCGVQFSSGLRAREVWAINRLGA